VVGAGSRFTSTNIGAQIIGSLNLGTITTSNNGHPFGVGAVTINSLSALLDIGGVLRMNRHSAGQFRFDQRVPRRPQRKPGRF